VTTIAVYSVICDASRCIADVLEAAGVSDCLAETSAEPMAAEARAEAYREGWRSFRPGDGHIYDLCPDHAPAAAKAFGRKLRT
jgi:hypothetical protein